MKKLLENNKKLYETGNIPGGGIFAWLQSLRGIAALLVFISHLPVEFPTNYKLVIGRTGVVTFFLITGYLSVLSREKRNGRQYLFNRFIRLYPIYWLLLILTRLVSFDKNISVAGLLWNAAYLTELAGFDYIIEPSWMMPVLVGFAVCVGLFGVKTLTKKCFAKHEIYLVEIVMLALSAGSILSGIIRKLYGIPIPTAFFLLFEVAIMGIALWDYKSKTISRKAIERIFIIYEIGLLTWSIYNHSDKWFAYVFAYNAGLFLFIIAQKTNFYWKAAAELGNMGFTFFLGADFINALYSKLISFSDSVLQITLECLLRFTLTLLLAAVITKYVEKPLLKAGKRVEKRMK